MVTLKPTRTSAAAAPVKPVTQLSVKARAASQTTAKKTVSPKPAGKKTSVAKAPDSKATFKKPAVKKPMVKKPLVKMPLSKVFESIKPEKAKKPKLVRDNFTIPKVEYVVLEALKQRATRLNRPVKKSELVRAGIKVLAAMHDTVFLATLELVPPIKTARSDSEN